MNQRFTAFKFLVWLCIILAALLIVQHFVNHKVYAQDAEIPLFVNFVQAPKSGGSFTSIAKMYDPYANVVCYETGWDTNGAGEDISCVSLNK